MALPGVEKRYQERGPHHGRATLRLGIHFAGLVIKGRDRVVGILFVPIGPVGGRSDAQLRPDHFLDLTFAVQQAVECRVICILQILNIHTETKILHCPNELGWKSCQRSMISRISSGIEALTSHMVKMLRMSDANFKVIFRGPAVDDGEIDVRDLAPALLALGDVFQAASVVLNGDRVKTVVRVKATEEACFEIDLSVAQTIKDALTTLIAFASENGDGIAAAGELADLILKGGAIAGGMGGGLFALLKFLRGKKPDKIEQRGGDVHVHVGDNIFVTNQKTIDLAENATVREGAKKFASVLKNTGIESISTKPQGEPEEVYTKTDLPAFELPPPVEEELVDETRQMNLQIISLSFKDDNKWRVTDGGEPFSAAIEDSDFLKQVANSEISFAKGDYLVCTVREKQTSTTQGLKKERTIVKVITHRPAARQMKLL